ncbi:LysR family transcriptional regulator [Pseudodesulfovibrio sp. zrk46]|uniref:LysR family transcriptional regulator n=1 Tax=Pseudodesulfovibrio sp. zrk46 TaxID=2725288 RepID=UPI001449846A|nr:LysR family transcriptional regulator [Pseudodesulfovibrio sp. zrk46]QJB57117.1 LysR family transcriptional regulator [Pseudodesulfovibrio sp. zrk46]
MINLEWLRTFKTVYEKGSMTAAAEALFISQPGVSLHLSSLEDHVGHKLFERAPRRLIPTERGKLLYNSVVDIINQLTEVEKNFQKSTREDTPSVTVGMCFETYRETLEKHVQDFDFNLILEFGEYRELLQKMAQGIIDLVVTPHKQDEPNILYRSFSQEHIVLAAGRDVDANAFHDALGTGYRQKVMDWLLTQRWYGITGDNEHLRRFWQLNFGAYPDFRPNYIVPNIHSIVTSLSKGTGVGVIPDFLCRREVERGDLQILWQGYKPLTNTLYIARRKNELHPEIIQHIEALLEAEMPDFQN